MNKLAPIFLFLGVLGLVVGCKKEMPAPENVKVGMTYDEIESAFGKPASIDRGYTNITLNDNDDFAKFRADAELSSDVQFLDKQLACLKMIEEKTKSDKRYILGIPAIETNGQLIYIRWTYPNAYIDNIAYDTIYSATPSWDTLHILKDIKTIKYYRKNIHPSNKDKNMGWEQIDEWNYSESNRLWRTYICKKENVIIPNVPVIEIRLIPKYVK